MEDEYPDFSLDVSQSTSSMRRVVIGKVNRWLRDRTEHSNLTFDTLQLSDVKKEFFGKFTSFLFRSLDSVDSCLSYLSHLKCALEEKFQVNFEGMQFWYKKT